MTACLFSSIQVVKIFFRTILQLGTRIERFLKTISEIVSFPQNGTIENLLNIKKLTYLYNRKTIICQNLYLLFLETIILFQLLHGGNASIWCSRCLNFHSHSKKIENTH